MIPPTESFPMAVRRALDHCRMVVDGVLVSVRFGLNGRAKGDVFGHPSRPNGYPLTTGRITKIYNLDDHTILATAAGERFAVTGFQSDFHMDLLVRMKTTLELSPQGQEPFVDS